MGELAQKVKKAATLRLRPGSVKIGEETFFFNFRVYPVNELLQILSELRRRDTAGAAALLADNIVDPADGRPVFTGKDLEELPNPDLKALADAFIDVNNGGPEKN